MKQEQWALHKKAVCSTGGVVAAQQVQAAACGADVLANGGNAIDAAVAAGLMLGVTEPWMCGIGGSGYMVVWSAATQRAKVFDFQGVLAQGIDPSDYPLDPMVPSNIMGFPGVVQNLNSEGYRSIAVPGAIKGFTEALSQFGSTGFDTLIQPAILAAEQGVPVNWFTTLQIALAAGTLLKDKSAQSLFLPGGVPLQPGEMLKMPALAETMKSLAADGPDSLYRGYTGERLVTDLRHGGCCIELDDLFNYQVQQSATLDTVHRGVTIHTAGPTSGGPRLIESLDYVADNLDTSKAAGEPGSASWGVYAQALKKAWHSHNQKIGRSTEVGGCTSHLSTVDRHGNMVALTFTLLDRFGSGVLLPSTGVLMNNAVSYFDPRPGHPTSMVGGKRINASNMCPVVATRDRQSLFSLGASGANYIVSCTTLITAMMLDFGLTLEQAINAPRLDVDGNHIVAADPRLGDDVIAELQRQCREHCNEQCTEQGSVSCSEQSAGQGNGCRHVSVEPLQVFPKRYACPSGVSRDPDSGLLCGISDPSHPFAGGVAV